MNGESQVLMTEVVMFPVQENKEINEIIELKENELDLLPLRPEVKVEITRFARLKKSLRKRSSASIL